MRWKDILFQAEKLNEFVRTERGTTKQWFDSKGFSKKDKKSIMEVSSRMAIHGIGEENDRRI